MEWYQTDTFDRERAVPRELDSYTGPHDHALVRLYPGGKTAPGWGLQPPKGGGQAFMQKYASRKFSPHLVGAHHDSTNEPRPFAFVMRAYRLLVLDLDDHEGAANGLDSAAKLSLPPTLAETSKSGKGRHLFYVLPQDTWDDERGFALYDDMIGILPGVDVRVTGCVYHHPHQKWNRRTQLSPAPQNLLDLLDVRAARKAHQKNQIATTVAEGDDVDTLIMHENLKKDLEKDIPPGKRNSTLFAIGHDLKDAQYPQWEDALYNRAIAVGLDDAEAVKIVENVGKYNR